ncbi:MAG: SURF1 family protein [Gammaproteobacteria bacterium]|nr:SURF1 family protein [Gammaproteobacteria bacterium]
MTPGNTGRWQAPWWGVVLLLVGVGIGTSAGFWQLDRAGEMRELTAQFAAGSKVAALGRLIRNDESATLRYQTLQLDGHYDSEHQVLLDGMSYQGRPGYQVLTPLITPAGEVLVNRGWIPAHGDRSMLPDIRVSAAPREVFGRVERLPRPGLRLAGDPPAPDAAWPRRLLFPTSAEIAAQIGTARSIVLRDYQLLLDKDDPDGYVRDWQPGGMDPARHLGYAVQWFGLALTVTVIYCVLMLRNRKIPS